MNEKSSVNQPEVDREVEAGGEFEILDERTPRTSVRSLDGTLLFLFGFGLALGGLALAAAPNISWQLTKIGWKIEAMGIGNGSLFVGGMILVGLGMLARSIASASAAAAEDEAETSLLLEQVAMEQAQTHAAQNRLDQRLASMVRTVQAQLEAVSRAAAGAGKQSGGSGETESTGKTDAVWRMAASLDKLGAHLDRSLEGFRSQIEEQVSSLEARVSRDLGVQVQTLGSRVEQLAVARVGQASECHCSSHDEPSEELQLIDPEPVRARPEPVFDAGPSLQPELLGSEPQPPVAEVQAQPIELRDPEPQPEPLPEPPAQPRDVMHELEEIEFLKGPEEQPSSASFEEPRAPLPKPAPPTPTQKQPNVLDLDSLLPDANPEER